MLISFATFCSFSPKTYVRKYSRLLLNTPLDICCIIFLNKNKKLKHEPKSLLLEKQRFHALLKKTVTNKYMKKKHVQKSFYFSLIQNMHIWKQDSMVHHHQLLTNIIHSFWVGLILSTRFSSTYPDCQTEVLFTEFKITCGQTSNRGQASKLNYGWVVLLLTENQPKK